MAERAFAPLSPLRVVVTAGASGIGRAIAEAFDASGARVRICDIDGAALAYIQMTLNCVTCHKYVRDVR